MIFYPIQLKKIRRNVHKKQEQVSKEQSKRGTTLVEMIVTLMLISIMMTIAVAS